LTIDEFLLTIEDREAPAPAPMLIQLEGEVGGPLADDYRRFLEACNGGYVGGALWYNGPTPSGGAADAGVHHVGGFREKTYLSLPRMREFYGARIPRGLLWIMDDPFGNAICLGLWGTHRGLIYFWDHEREPAPYEWDGQIESARNVSLIANSFTEFVTGLKPATDD
jgi:hypothetical protein